MTHEAALATSVQTLQAAVELSFNTTHNEDVLFRYARALKAFEVTTGAKMTAQELENAFAAWWRAAVRDGKVPAEASFDEYRMLFLDAFDKAKAPLGANPLQQAIERADRLKPPPEADRYQSPPLQRLVGVCYQLQELAGDSPFFLSVRNAAMILDIKRMETVSAYLGGLVRDGILREVEKGRLEGRRASRFRYIRAGRPATKGGKEARQPRMP